MTSGGITEPCLYHSPYARAFPNILPLHPCTSYPSVSVQQFTTYTLHTDAPFRARSGGYLPCMPTIRVSSHQFRPVNHSSPEPGDDWSRIVGQLYGAGRNRESKRGVSRTCWLDRKTVACAFTAAMPTVGTSVSTLREISALNCYICASWINAPTLFPPGQIIHSFILDLGISSPPYFGSPLSPISGRNIISPTNNPSFITRLHYTMGYRATTYGAGGAWQLVSGRETNDRRKCSKSNHLISLWQNEKKTGDIDGKKPDFWRVMLSRIA